MYYQITNKYIKIMATRSTIKVEGVDYAKVYKHWDGMPESMLPWLQAFNEEFVKERGDDAPYKFAQLLRFSEREKEKYQLDPSKCTGRGVVSYHEEWNVEYEYTLKVDGTVTFKRMH